MRFLVFFMVCLVLVSPCHAAFKSSADAVRLDETYNPHPNSDDIILPMPCGLSIALKAIAVPQGALIRDKSFPMGITNAQDADRQIYERQFPGYIAAPFTSADLPKSWSAKLQHSKTSSDSWYFIGKYEISQMQWDAVTKALDNNGQEDPAACPTKPVAASRLPVTGISWFDAQEFLNKYNAWLVKNHVKSLPAFAGTPNIAFFRLPTEEEWEYAARGGANVPPEWWADHDLFPLQDDKTINDYAVISKDQIMNAPAAIGSRQPNQAGLHDTAGNAREMVDGFFRMSIPDLRNGQVIRRLHGAAGGILTKGGSYASTLNEYLPGWRDEVPLYTAQGPSRPGDLGLRIALSGLNVPNAQRLKELRKEAGSEHFIPKTPEDLGSTPMEAVDALAANADETLKDSLSHLRQLIEAQTQAQDAQNQQTLENTFRSLLYQSETLRAFAFRYSAAQLQLDRIRALLAQSLDQANRTKAKNVENDTIRDMKGFWQSLEMGANYYKRTLGEMAQNPPKEINPLFTQLLREYGSGTIFDQHMRKNIDSLGKFLAIVRKRGIQALDTRAILSGILPKEHYKILPKS